jgi:PKD repeat protein
LLKEKGEKPKMFSRKKVVFLVALILSVALLVQPIVIASPTPPVASFTYTPQAPILGQIVFFNASASYDPDGGSINSYKWDFDDGTIYTILDAVTSHNYTAFGTYNVTLTVTDDEAETDTTWQIVTVREYPVAFFTYSPNYPIVSETVTFDASLSNPNGGTITSYFWDFGDNSNGTGVIVIHAYAAIGNYNVTLTVTDNENLTDTTWDILEVRKLPVAFFTYSPTTSLEGETVTFNASLSTPNGGTIVSYEWDFDDGSSPVTEADPIITHSYTTFGTYDVTLTITDSENLTDTYSDAVRILIHPVANFTYSPTTPIVNETVTFDASVSYDPDRSIVSYRWDFGDGSSPVTEADPIATHNYTAEGTYNVTLTVTDDDTLTDTTYKLVTVYTFVYVHDVAIINVTTSAPAEVYVGDMVNITVVAKNEGTAAETFSVSVYYNATSVGTKMVSYLLPGSEITLTFSLDHTGVTAGNYIIRAEASVVSGETETTDNTLVDGTVKVKIQGDINADGIVDIVDIVTVAISFGSATEDDPETPWDETENWNPIADVNNDGAIDIVDIVMVAIHFGEMA